MTSTELKELKTALDNERQVFLDRLDHQLDHPEQYRDEILKKLTTSENKLLHKIDLALEQIENDTYGICTHCGKEIPLARLKAKPSVSLCRNCQDQHEQAS